MNIRADGQTSFEQLIASLHQLSHGLSKQSDLLLRQNFGFSISQFKIVWVLRKHVDGVPQKNIANWLRQTESAVSRQMQPMVTEGLIDIIVNPKNRRVRLVLLTAKGEAFATRAMCCMEDAQDDSFRVLTASERSQLHDLLTKVFKRFCQKVNESNGV